ncbi:MAG: hypothetical protein Q9218_002094 [Villophora microphyllina]
MVSKAGAALKGVSTLLRIIEFLGSALILGITSYWLGVLTHRHAGLPTWMKAVEGMSGGAVIYTGLAVIMTIFLGGLTFFAFLGLLLDILFVGAMVAIAILTRGGVHKCSGKSAPSVLGPGNKTSCRLETAVFAVAIAMALCFLVSAALQVLLQRQHKREKRYGPGPSNGYTSGSGKKQPFWKRGKGNKTTHETAEMGTFDTNGVGHTNGTTTANGKGPFWKRNKNTTHDAELGVAGGSALIAEEKHHHDKHNRISHETGVTGTTAHSPNGAPGVAYGGPNDRYNEPTIPPVSHGHHHNQVPELTTGTATGGYQPYREGAGLPQGHTQVVHDSSPYAEVHHNGRPHVEPNSTFGHAFYSVSSPSDYSSSDGYSSSEEYSSSDDDFPPEYSSHTPRRGRLSGAVHGFRDSNAAHRANDRAGAANMRGAFAQRDSQQAQRDAAYAAMAAQRHRERECRAVRVARLHQQRRRQAEQRLPRVNPMGYVAGRREEHQRSRRAVYHDLQAGYGDRYEDVVRYVVRDAVRDVREYVLSAGMLFPRLNGEAS